MHPHMYTYIFLEFKKNYLAIVQNTLISLRKSAEVGRVNTEKHEATGPLQCCKIAHVQ